MKKLKIGVIGSIIEGDFADLILGKGIVIEQLAENFSIPIILPITKNKEIVEKLVQELDGIILQEGQTVSPFIYGENPKIRKQDYLFERDFSELIYLEMAEKYDIKVLGINRGAHIINIYFGGDLYQDLEKEIPNDIYHIGTEDCLETYHLIEIVEDSELYNLLGKKELVVKSRHNQVIKILGKNLKISARSEDGVVEAFEGKNFMGIQFSLENMEKEYTKDIFKYFVKSGGKNNE